jgi:hypothetical protein
MQGVLGLKRIDCMLLSAELDLELAVVLFALLKPPVKHMKPSRVMIDPTDVLIGFEDLLMGGVHHFLSLGQELKCQDATVRQINPQRSRC